MTFCLNQLMTVYPDQLWSEFSWEEQDQAWRQAQDHSNDAARWNAYLNNLCMKTFVTWLEEEPDWEGPPLVLPHPSALAGFWEVVNGTAITFGLTRLVLIPCETDDLKEFYVPQEWVDIPDWVADYYIAVQVNLENHWLRFWGYTTHRQLKQKGNYDLIAQTYSLEHEDLIEDLNVMLVTRELCVEAKVAVKALPSLSSTEVEKLLAQLGQPSPYSPRLDVSFEQWGALLANDEWRQRLYQQRLANLKSEAETVQADVPSKRRVNLSLCLQGNFVEAIKSGWQMVEEFLGTQESNLAFSVGSGLRANYPSSSSVADLTNLLCTSHDEEVLWIAAEHLAQIAPGHPEAVKVLTNLLRTNQDERIRLRAAHGLGKIDPGNQDAINALVALLRSSQNEEILWIAAEHLAQIDPSNPAGGIRLTKLIDLEMQLTPHSVELLVALLPKADQEVGILLRVCAISEQSYLPLGLKLIALDELGEPVLLPSEEPLEVQSGKADNYIQLHLTAQPPGDQFSAKIALGDVSITEDLVI